MKEESVYQLEVKYWLVKHRFNPVDGWMLGSSLFRVGNYKKQRARARQVSKGQALRVLA